MTALIAWLAEAIGLKGMAKGLVKWGLRLCLLVLLIALGVAVYNNKELQIIALRVALLWLLWLALRWSYRLEMVLRWALRLFLLAAAITCCGFAPPKITISLAVLALAGLVFEWWRSHRKGEADDGERTIDWKVVPNKLAVAALAIPSHSPDGDYVLRGLPDYGKALLKLNKDDFEFEYVPEIPEPKPKPEPNLPSKEPAIKRSRFWVPPVPPWVMAVSGVLLVSLEMLLDQASVLSWSYFAIGLASIFVIWVFFQWARRWEKLVQLSLHVGLPLLVVALWHIGRLNTRSTDNSLVVLVLAEAIFQIFRWRSQRDELGTSKRVSDKFEDVSESGISEMLPELSLKEPAVKHTWPGPLLVVIAALLWLAGFLDVYRAYLAVWSAWAIACALYVCTTDIEWWRGRKGETPVKRAWLLLRRRFNNSVNIVIVGLLLVIGLTEAFGSNHTDAVFVLWLAWIITIALNLLWRAFKWWHRRKGEANAVLKRPWYSVLRPVMQVIGAVLLLVMSVVLLKNWRFT